MKNTIFTLVILITLISCDQKKEPIAIGAEDFHRSVDRVGAIMVHDIFSPPVASRIFAYPSIAAYEIIAQNNEKYQSLAKQVAELTPIPKADPNREVNFQLAALIAHMDLNRQLIFSEERMISYRDSLYTVWEEKNPEEFNDSKDYGLLVSKHVKEWMDGDNYKQTRTMSKFTVDTDDPSRWQPTPPSYMDGLEPHWNKIRPFVLDSAAQFKPIPPPDFSMDTDSKFYQELKEVYDISNEITCSFFSLCISCHTCNHVFEFPGCLFRAVFKSLIYFVRTPSRYRSMIVSA